MEALDRKVGDTITLRSETLKTDGTGDWSFDIVGTIETPQANTPAYLGVINYGYLDEYRAQDRGTAEMFYVRIDDPTKAVVMAKAIDAIFANSSHETRTRSQQARAESQAKQMGDVKLFTNAIMAAVLFVLAFLTGNTLRQSLQDRIARVRRVEGGGLFRRSCARALRSPKRCYCVYRRHCWGLGLRACSRRCGRKPSAASSCRPAVVAAGLDLRGVSGVRRRRVAGSEPVAPPVAFALGKR